MDKLSDLPTNGDTIKTAEESEIINQFFPPVESSGNNSGGVVQNHNQQQPQNAPIFNSSKLNWKLIGLSSLLFVALANPLIDSLFCKMPYCGGNAMSLLGIKVLLFIMAMIVISLVY